MDQPITHRDHASTDELTQFYADVLPAQGAYCLFLLPSRRTFWAKTITELVRATRAATDQLEQVYFGTCSFAEPTSRTQNNVASLRSLRLDIDAGPEKRAKHGEAVYATQREAALAVIEFTKNSRLRPTYVVSSGAGLHLYFCLDQDLSPGAWRPLASGLSQLCKSHGLKVDGAVTSDTARLLRPLGTRHTNGTRVRIVKYSGERYDVATLRDLMPASGGLDIASVGSQAAALNADVLDGSHTPYSYLQAARKCQAMRQAAVKHGAETPYPVWVLALVTAANAVEGRSLGAYSGDRDRPFWSIVTGCAA